MSYLKGRLKWRQIPMKIWGIDIYRVTVQNNIHKQTVCWFLTDSNTSLSADRLKRVQQSSSQVNKRFIGNTTGQFHIIDFFYFSLFHFVYCYFVVTLCDTLEIFRFPKISRNKWASWEYNDNPKNPGSTKSVGSPLL